MNPREVKTISDAKKIVGERGLSHVKVGLFDNDWDNAFKEPGVKDRLFLKHSRSKH